MNKSRTYLITGATGDIGSRVVNLLLNQGERPRVFVRDATKALTLYGDRVDIVVGDLTDEASMRTALRGIDALFLVNTGPELAQRDRMAAKIARTIGVKHIVKLSSMDVKHSVGTGPWHERGEAAIRESGVPFTFVQPAGFMSNALGWANSIKSEGTVRSCTGEGKIAFIHLDDIAAVALTALTMEGYDGESLPISGPEALSYREMTSKIGAALGKSLTFQTISEDQARQQLVSSGESSAVVEAHILLWRAIREGHLATVTGEVERVIGRKSITFEEWAVENAAAFR